MRNMFGVRYRNFGCIGELCAVFLVYLAVLLYLVQASVIFVKSQTNVPIPATEQTTILWSLSPCQSAFWIPSTSSEFDQNWITYQYDGNPLSQFVINAIKISSISVPRSIDNRTSEPARLNCIFEFDRAEETNLTKKELVIQWRLNNSTILYQWVYEGLSFVNKTFKEYIDTRYEVPNNSKPTSMPLTFIRKSVDLTGLYTCSVQTFDSDDSAEAQLQVYVPIEDINLNVTCNNETNEMRLTCSAQGIYPRPKLVLSVNKNTILQPSHMSIVQRDYLYDITATYSMSLHELSASTTFNCTVSLPEANINQSKTYLYIKSGSEFSDNSITSEYTNKTSSPLTDGTGAGASCKCYLDVTIMLLFYTLLAISTSRK